MNEQHDLSSADLTTASVGKRKRTKKKPLWCRIIYDDQMVALVRLLGHAGMPLKEMRDKAKPLVEKFGRERLQEAADEIVETIGDGDDAIVRLTEQAQKLAIQLIGRPRPESSMATADSIAADSQPPAAIESEAISPTAETNSATTPCEPNLLPSIAASSSPPTASAVPIESSPTLAREQTEDGSREWTNYVTSCVAAFLNDDRQFADECLHLAKQCCERAAHCESVTSGIQTESQAQTLLLAEQLQRLVCEYNPLAEEEVSPFSDLLDSALSNVDWHDLADSFLNRLKCSAEECDED